MSCLCACEATNIKTAMTAMAPMTPPSTSEASTETTPTVIDIRVPQIRRLSMSRPNWSVPSGNSLQGKMNARE